MKKTALLVIYNHRYDKNIKRVHELYQNSFTYIYHLMPFYDGDNPNVIPVYESSHQFQSYISQAYTVLKTMGFTHFFVISDDLILNPIINENSLWDVCGIPDDYCMLPYYTELQNCSIKGWPRIKDAIDYKVEQDGVEVKNILPSKEDAKELFAFHQLSVSPITRSTYRRVYPYFKLGSIKLWRKGPRKPIELDYPLVGGYCDTCLITADCMQKFCSYCGAFAAGNLFVELAIPTALFLATRKLIVCSKLKLKDGAMWTAEDKRALEKYENNLQKLLADFPADKMYLHPVKLSAWS